MAANQFYCFFQSRKSPAGSLFLLGWSLKCSFNDELLFLCTLHSSSVRLAMLINLLWVSIKPLAMKCSRGTVCRWLYSRLVSQTQNTYPTFAKVVFLGHSIMCLQIALCFQNANCYSVLLVRQFQLVNSLGHCLLLFHSKHHNSRNIDSHYFPDPLFCRQIDMNMQLLYILYFLIFDMFIIIS
jgi:hypothetical protein